MKHRTSPLEVGSFTYAHVPPVEFTGSSCSASNALQTEQGRENGESTKSLT